MNRKVTVHCPYCGHGNVISASNEYREKQVVTCDLDGGGCDRDFVEDICVSITAKALKIEGQEPAQAGEDGQNGN